MQSAFYELVRRIEKAEGRIPEREDIQTEILVPKNNENKALCRKKQTRLARNLLPL